MKAFLIGLLLSFHLALAGANTAVALDDFNLRYFGTNDIIKIGRTEFILKIQLYDDEQALLEAYSEVTGTDREVAGFTQFSPDNPVCYVHIVPAGLWDDREKMTILGHEIYHCMLATHKEQE